MIKFKKIEDKLQIVRVDPTAPAGQRNQVLGSFKANRKTLPANLIAKMTQQDLAELVGRAPVVAWAPRSRPKSA